MIEKSLLKGGRIFEIYYFAQTNFNLASSVLGTVFTGTTVSADDVKKTWAQPKLLLQLLQQQITYHGCNRRNQRHKVPHQSCSLLIKRVPWGCAIAVDVNEAAHENEPRLCA